ncbi:MAG: efflux RND transporter periplasmic adaptor subunit [Opitutaceae bacterium]|jgi:RND family efflux transporter MFP subunit
MRTALFRTITVSAFLLLGVAAAGLSAAPEQTVRAQLTPCRYAVISSEIAAKIDRLTIREGLSFDKGDELVSFDDALQQAQLKRAQAVLTASRLTLAANERLLALKSIGQLELDLSKAEVTKAAAELSYAESTLEKCRILAPFSGRVSELKVREKEFVQPGQALFEIIDNSVPELEFIAPSRWLAWLTVGQSLTVHIDETGRDYAAAIERIGAKVDPVSRTVKLVATITGSHPELIAGMSGTILLPEPTAPQSTP